MPPPHTVSAVALVAALVGVGVYVKMKSKKPPASAPPVALTAVSLTTGKEKDLEGGGGAPATKAPLAIETLPSTTSKVDKKAEEKAAASAAKQAAAAKAAEEKAAAAAAKEAAAQEVAAKKASAKQAKAQEASAAKGTKGQAAVEQQSAGKQFIVWLTEKCAINASDAKLYADAFAELGIETPEDLQMIDGDEVAWPSVVKPVHRKKLQAALESSRK